MLKKNIETEIKYKITFQARAALEKLVIKKGFKYFNKENIRDNFVYITKSKLGGWNFLRLRNIDDKIFYKTTKKWLVDKNGLRVRLEMEKKIGRKHYFRLLKERLKITIEKTRTNYHGKIGNHQVTISLDELVVNHKKYNFLECETITDVESSQPARNELKRWLNKNLKINTKREAQSMIDFINSIKK